MGNQKTMQREEAQALYMQGLSTQAEICERVDIDERTLRRWIKEEGWDVLRAANNVTRKKSIVSYLIQLQKLNEVIEARPDNPYPTTAEADIITKITKSIKSLEKDLTLTDYLQAFEELMRFAKSVSPESVPVLLPVTKEFVNIKAKELARER